jgi:hypothetical protein
LVFGLPIVLILSALFFIPGSLIKQHTYTNTGTEIAVNLGSAYGHFDNLCLISADKIKTIGRPKTKRC